MADSITKYKVGDILQYNNDTTGADYYITDVTPYDYKYFIIYYTLDFIDSFSYEEQTCEIYYLNHATTLYTDFFRSDDV